MLKKKIGIIALILIITIALALPVVRAVDEPAATTTAEDTTQTVENTATEETTTTEESAAEQDTAMTEENFKQHDVYLTGDDVTIDYIVDGNLFVMAKNVTIDGYYYDKDGKRISR